MIMYEADVAITGGTLVTVDEERRVIEDGLVLIEGERLSYVGPAEDVQWRAEEVVRADGDLILPGLVDVHGHAGHGLVKSLGDGPGSSWLEVAEEVYFRAATGGFWREEARLSALERLKFGVTTGYCMLGSMPRADDARWALLHAEGVSSVGIRDIVGVGPAQPPWPIAVRRFEGDRVEDDQLTLEQSLQVTEEVCRAHAEDEFPSRTAVHVSPSRVGDPAGLGEDVLRYQTDEVIRIARDFDLMINTHVYAGGIEHAHRNSEVLGPGTLLAHSTGISQREVQILAETGAQVAHCPSARAVVRGWCPVVPLLEAGVNVALATDGSGPDRSFCLFKELRTAAIIHRIHEGDETVLPPGRLLEMATIDAARAVGMEEEVGSLEAGKLADVIVVDAAQPHQYPRGMPVHRLAYVTTGADVKTVMVAGEVLMRDRTALTVDEDEVLDAAQEEFSAMLERSGLAAEMHTGRNIWRTVRPEVQE